VAPESVLLATPRWTRDGGVGAHVQASAAALARHGVPVGVVAARVDAGTAAPGVTVHHAPRLFDAAAPLPERLGGALSASPEVIHLHQIDDPALVKALRGHAPVAISAHAYTACTSGLHHLQPGRECTRGHGPGCAVYPALGGCAPVRHPKTLPAKYRNAGRGLAALRAADIAIVYSRAVERHLADNGLARRAIVPLFPTLPPARIGDATRTDGEATTADGDATRAHLDATRAHLDATGANADAARRRVVFAGRISAPKGLDVLLRAVGDLDAELVVCGDGVRLEATRRLARRLGIEGRVAFRGWLDADDLARELADAAVLALPSRWPEPFGLVGIEALAAGRPVVASLAGGVRDWLQDGVNGLGVPPADPRALARALEQLLDDPERRRAMGEAGRELVAARFSPGRHVEALVEGYEAAQSGWRGTPPRSRRGSSSTPCPSIQRT